MENLRDAALNEAQTSTSCEKLFGVLDASTAAGPERLSRARQCQTEIRPVDAKPVWRKGRDPDRETTLRRNSLLAYPLQSHHGWAILCIADQFQDFSDRARRAGRKGYGN
jgi:hypothetical protein